MTSEFLGFETNSLYFEIAAAVFVLCLLLLILDCLCRCRRERTKEKEDTELLSASLVNDDEAGAQGSQQEIECGRVGGAVEMQPAKALSSQSIVPRDDDDEIPQLDGNRDEDIDDNE